MAEWFVGRREDFQDETRKFVKVGGKEVGVICKNGNFYAFENNCVHQGGPVCEGKILAKVEPVLAADKRCLGERFSDDEFHLVCPWHGWEFLLETGEAAGNKVFKLNRYNVEVREGGVYIVD